jgi:hypothetical protein
MIVATVTMNATTKTNPTMEMLTVPIMLGTTNTTPARVVTLVATVIAVTTTTMVVATTITSLGVLLMLIHRILFEKPEFLILCHQQLHRLFYFQHWV